MALILQQAGHALWRLAYQTLLDSYYFPLTLLVPLGLVVLGLPLFFYLWFARSSGTTNVSIHMEQNQRSAQVQYQHHGLPQPRRRSSTAILLDEAIRAVQQRTLWRKISIFVGVPLALSSALACYFYSWQPTLHTNRLFPLRTLMDSATEASHQSDAVYKAATHINLLTSHVKTLTPKYDGQQLRQLMVRETGNQGLCWSDMVGATIQETNTTALQLHTEASALKQMNWWSWRKAIERLTIMGESILASSCSEAAAANQPRLCVSDTKHLVFQALSEVGGLEDKAKRTRTAAANLLLRFGSLRIEAADVHDCYERCMLAQMYKVKQLELLPWYWKLARRVILPDIERNQVELAYRRSTRRFELEDHLGRANIEKLLTVKLGAQHQLPEKVLHRFIQSLDQYLELTLQTTSDLRELAEDMADKRHTELNWEQRQQRVFVRIKTMVKAIAPLAIDLRPIESSLAKAG